jgi:hypothetical protein
MAKPVSCHRGFESRQVLGVYMCTNVAMLYFLIMHYSMYEDR